MIDHFTIAGIFLGSAIALLAVAVTLAALIPTFLDLRPAEPGMSVGRRRVEDAAARFVKQLQRIAVICGLSVVTSIVGLIFPNCVSTYASSGLLIIATLALVWITLVMYTSVFRGSAG